MKPENKTYFCIDEDGTEKASNNSSFRGDTFAEINLKFRIDYPNPEKFEGKWFNSFTEGYYTVPQFTGVILPKGTIEKLTGKKLTWEDDPVRLDV